MQHNFLLDLEPHSWVLLTHSAPGSCSQINVHTLQAGELGECNPLWELKEHLQGLVGMCQWVFRSFPEAWKARKHAPPP